MKKISRTNLSELFGQIAAVRKLYIPTEDRLGQAKFSEYADGMEFSTKQTVRSAKDLFFPQVENLVGFKVTGKQLEILETRNVSEDFVLFGVRGCDFRSFEILDKVFLAEPADTYYKERRDHVTVVTLSCSKPDETCFCGKFGIDNTEPGGDATVWMDSENLYWRANTEKGEKLTASLTCLEDCGEEGVEACKQRTKEIKAKLPLRTTDFSRVGAGKTKELFNDPAWDKLSEACLGCGTCTFVCPTCQCYDIEEFNDGKIVRRFRCWDSCMYKDFTKMSAGQPRPTQKERFRQRFMHKLVYFPDNNNGQFGCVGCGRCLKKCPIHMNIIKVVNALGEEKK